MRAALGLGSNLGDRRAHLDAAVAGLPGVVAVSSTHETRPVGGPPQGLYLNAAVVVETDLDPRGLLAVARRLEYAAGRNRSGGGQTERWEPRTLDVDVLLCDDLVVCDDGPPALTIPHPRLAERAFVLAPLAEIARDWVVPGTDKTVEQLLEDLQVRP